MHHLVLFTPPGGFAGWPANNGLWAWDDGEILVGCSTGAFEAQSGHNVSGPFAASCSAAAMAASRGPLRSRQGT